MKYIVSIFLFSIVFFSGGTVYAQSCATIEGVSSSTPTVASGKPYTCNVTVAEGSAGSKNIACGVSFDGGYPFDFCPSDEFFSGWSGNVAGFNCVFPNTNIPKDIKKVELVGYDFGAGCGPEQGKRVEVTLVKDASPSAEQKPEDQLPQVRTTLWDVLKDIFGGGGGDTGGGNDNGDTGGGDTGGGDTGNGTPSPTAGSTNTSQTVKQLLKVDSASYGEDLKSKMRPCLANAAQYQGAEKASGVAWQVLAGIHKRESDGCDSSRSLVSGRPIGGNEPDVPRATCSSGRSGPGVPFPNAQGGCSFRTFQDTVIYAAEHLKGKIGKTPETFEELAKALARYNGSANAQDGNANCGRHAQAIKQIYGYSIPYSSCPAQFWGDDNPYVMNLFDSKHQGMAILFCADGQYCNAYTADRRMGSLTGARVISTLSQ